MNASDHLSALPDNPSPRAGRPTIGLLVARIGRVWSREFMDGLVDAAEAQDVNLLCYVGGPPLLQPGAGYGIYDLIDRHHLDGLILSADLGHNVSQEALQEFCDHLAPLPMVALAMNVKGIPTLLPDSYGGMRQAVEHLIEVHGYRQIAFIQGLAGQLEAEQRYQAYVDALEAHHIPLDAALVAPGDYTPESGRAAMRLLLDERKVQPQAVVVANDRMAFGALDVLQEHGLQVPQDVALTGFDDVLEAQFLGVPLTTVRQLFYNIGQQAILNLQRLLRGDAVPERMIVPTELVVRWSCGCLPRPIRQATIAETAAARPAARPLTPEAAALSEQDASLPRLEAHKPSILTALLEAANMGGSRVLARSVSLPRPALQDIFSEVLNTFLSDLREDSHDQFLKAFEQALQQLRAAGKGVTIWHGVLSAMRRQVLPQLSNAALTLRAENLFQQARLLVGEMAQRAQAFQRLAIEQQEEQLQRLSFALATSLTLKDLGTAASEHFPELGIHHCQVVLYESSQNLWQASPPKPSSLSRLLLKYRDRQAEVTTRGPSFPAAQLACQATPIGEQRFTGIFTPLDLGEAPLGFMYTEVGPHEWEVYTRIRNLFSSAIFRALLVRDREQATQEIGRLLAEAELNAIELARAKETIEASARQLQQALQETEGLFHAAQAILGANETTEICQNLSQHFTSLVQADRVLIFLLDHEQRRITLAVHNGAIVDDLDTTYEELSQGISGLVCRTGMPVLSPSADDGIEPPEIAERRRRAGTGAVIVVPLTIKGEVIGTVTALNRVNQRQFTHHDVDLLMSLSTQAAAAIENARLFKAEQDRRHVAELLVQAGRKLSSSLKLHEVPRRILEQLQMVVPYERGSLMLREGNNLRIVAQHGFPDDERVRDLRISIREGDVFQQVAAAGHPVLIDDVTQIAGWTQVDWLPLNQSWMGVPLFSQDRVIGMVSLTRRPARAFSRDDAVLVSTFALQAAIALENAGLYEEITRFNEQLEQMVQQRTEELHRAYQALERLDKNKSDFINVAAHELRTPLTIMKGYAAMLQADPTLRSNAYLLESLNGILRGTDRLHEIVNSMLDVARIDSQVLDLHPEQMSLMTIAKRVQADYASDLAERRIELHLDGLENLPRIYADPTLLLKVFQNVVANAIKYTPDGGHITIWGRSLDDEVLGAAVEVVIQDTGIGIDPEYHELIFEKFYQTGKVALHSSGKTKFKGGGPGLGLSIARGIVQAHRGRIWVESSGQNEETCPGSQFHILLPVGGILAVSAAGEPPQSADGAA